MFSYLCNNSSIDVERTCTQPLKHNVMYKVFIIFICDITIFAAHTPEGYVDIYTQNSIWYRI